MACGIESYSSAALCSSEISLGEKGTLDYKMLLKMLIRINPTGGKNNCMMST